ncbi:MAG TPA: LPS assembly lipoprotein LptE [Bryobacterales bacterium]|nr:LPS assembly lipoprotein LptE [Bryobacterales bacterium]
MPLRRRCVDVLPLVLLPSLFFSACGYRVAGRGDQIPKDVQTIAVLPFGNATSRYKLDEYLTRAVTHEFITRTRFRITPDEKDADAVLRGAVINLLVNPVIYDPKSGRATSVQLVTQMQVTLSDRHSGKVIYQNQNFESRENYEVSIDPRAYFEESEVGLQRLSQSVSRNLVSAILEKF